MPVPRLSKRSRRLKPGEPGEELRLWRILPDELHMVGHARDEDQVERTLAYHLEGDVDIAAARVMGLGRLHTASLSLGRRFGKCFSMESRENIRS